MHTLAEGSVLQNRYRIGKVLGKGGMGMVYRARDGNLDCDVAVKQAFFNEDDDLRAAFEREAKLLRRLTHANLPKVTDLFTEGSVQYLVMDFIAGRTLKELLRASGGTIPTEQALGWADQVLAVLEYLHGRTPPVVHRDIKPANLKLTEQGDLYLLDFGLAKGFHTQASRTFGSGSVAGHTPGYAPIEQMQSAGTDGRSDLYALGATVYHLVTGVAPPDASVRFLNLADGQPDPLRPAHAVNPKIPARVSAALERALAMSSGRRPATAAEMRRELREATVEPPVVRPVASAPPPPVAPPKPISVEPPKPAEPKSEPPPVVRPVVSAPQPKSAPPAADPPAQMNVEQAKNPNARSAIVFTGIIVLAAFLMVIGLASYRDAPSESPLKTSPYELAESSSKTKKSLPKSFKNEIGMEFVLVTAGRFLMGSPESEANHFSGEGPRHEVTIGSPFYLGKYEVTQGEWKAVMGSNPSWFTGDDRLPVERMSWDDCQEFIKKLNARKDGYEYRLPSEAEWEYACRAGTATAFSFGETITAEQVNYNGNYPYGNAPKGEYRGKTTRVGSFPPNAWGLYDMHGNVFEWCQDGWHKNYDGAPSDGRAREQGSDNGRVLRGGSWLVNANYCRSAYRDRSAPSDRGDGLGLRVAVRTATN